MLCIQSIRFILFALLHIGELICLYTTLTTSCDVPFNVLGVFCNLSYVFILWKRVSLVRPAFMALYEKIKQSDSEQTKVIKLHNKKSCIVPVRKIVFLQLVRVPR